MFRVLFVVVYKLAFMYFCTFYIPNTDYNNYVCIPFVSSATLQ